MIANRKEGNDAGLGSKASARPDGRFGVVADPDGAKRLSRLASIGSRLGQIRSCISKPVAERPQLAAYLTSARAFRRVSSAIAWE
jgi:hypothetical protein